MIVSESRNYVFVHVSKTGGSAIRRAFMPMLDRERDAESTFWGQRGEDLPRAGLNPDMGIGVHCTATRMKEALGAERYERAFRFAFVRNPFSRAYSGFKWLQKEATQKQHDPGYPEQNLRYIQMTFDEAMIELSDIYATNPALYKQVHWLPKPGLMSFIGRFENFGDDLKRVWDHVAPDLPSPDAFKQVNVSTKKDEWRGMGAYAVDRIRTVYAEDFERFGYSKDPAAPNPPTYPMEFEEKDGKKVSVPFNV